MVIKKHLQCKFCNHLKCDEYEARYLAGGYTQKEIAEEMGLSQTNISTHFRRHCIMTREAAIKIIERKEREREILGRHNTIETENSVEPTNMDKLNRQLSMLDKQLVDIELDRDMSLKEKVVAKNQTVALIHKHIESVIKYEELSSKKLVESAALTELVIKVIPDASKPDESIELSEFEIKESAPVEDGEVAKVQNTKPKKVIVKPKKTNKEKLDKILKRKPRKP
jgi:predicted transcriptional regulator